ncbi:MAG: hypothetical protein SGBAC_006729 [Bacillariaceae sp.]
MLIEAEVGSSDSAPQEGQDALDMVFESIEGYTCGNSTPKPLDEDWNPDFADRGQAHESISEVWSLHKLGDAEVQKRGSVADRIKAFEASKASASSPRSKNDRPVMRPEAEPRSTSPVSRWTKPSSRARPPMENAPRSPGSPASWSRPAMVPASPGSPASWKRPSMLPASSHGSPSWQRPTMEKSPQTPRSDVTRSSTKVPVPPRHATSAQGKKFEKKQSIPAWPSKLKSIPRKSAHPDAIVVRILKDSAKEASGLSFVSYFEKEGIYISKIRDTSKFKNTFLKPGMKVLRINGVPCPGRVKNVIKMLKSAKRVVDIEAIKDNSIAFVAREKQPNEETSAKKNGSSGEPSKETTTLSREMENDEATGESSDENEEMGFTDLFMLSMGYVPNIPQEENSIERKDSSVSIASLDRSEIPEKPKNKKVHAMVFKRTRRDKIGISFVSFKKKRGVYIYEMFEDSKFQRTGLEVGMKVLAINRQPCPERVSETLAMVKDVQGQLIITAATPSDEIAPSSALAGVNMLSKQSAHPKVMSLQKIGRDQRRKYQPNVQIEQEGDDISEGEVLDKNERIDILEDLSWPEDRQNEVTNTLSQDSHTTASGPDEIADDGSFVYRWGSSVVDSVFGM